MKLLKIISALINILVGIITTYKFIKQIQMETVSIELFLWTIGLLLLTMTTVFIYFIDKIKLLKKYIDDEANEKDELIYFLHNVNENKRQHILKGLKEGKILPDPQNFMDSEALRVHEKAQANRKKIRDEISRQL